MTLHYDWQASLAALALILVITLALKAIVFQLPAIKRTRELDREQNEMKLSKRSAIYGPRVKLSQNIGFASYIFSHVAILPFLVTWTTPPLWRVALDVFVILMLYDFLYYLVHRYLFHGEGYFLKVHSVHHQARSRVSSIDSHLLHPAEVSIGIGLYYLTIVLLAVLGMAPFSVASIVVSSLIYINLNMINHCRIDLDQFPYRTLNWIAMKHDAHHLDMRHGNYATITLLYDKLFGTLETHPREVKPG